MNLEVENDLVEMPDDTLPDVDPEEVSICEYRHDEISVHVVQSGENLMEIAENRLGNGDLYREIMTVNGLEDEEVHEGQILKLPEV